MAFTIPAGVPVGMSCPLVHMNPDLFPQPARFRPKRWLNDAPPGLAGYTLAFSNGSRQCIGINLTYAELRASIIADMRHDLFVRTPKLDTKGIGVLVK
ncbi:benzoate 4-monooxygenase cytochrome p450 [Diplodia corticola]|uniref:Benzoate 4-monooxygenase cytochrome p450 n=1 Tax=Diplodia corticola TaxID=236234 RepID=A0A1J9RLB1_9PEZI|nr:benzoate 4-monooxygenase cytochrome p450 [Diplodia corticola]OJD28708.1 benzoate 4-monooxygenase cytochrome p450 [Diplodia corticola]